ncbi:MAG: hypothetical protein ACLP8X_35610 [Streptosporangiaceae bacterium]
MNPGYRRTCARCGNYRFAAARFPDGHICQGCLVRALRTRSACPGCRTEQLLIGRLAGGVAGCRQCAGITREFSCRHCGYEGEHCITRICARCSLPRRLGRLLDDGTGRPSPALAPLAEALCADPDLDRVLNWIRKPHVRALLSGLATGRIELTHAGLGTYPARRTAICVRDLLVSCGVLPAADKQLLDYQAWLHQRLAALDGHPHQRLLRQFGQWHQLARMRAAAAARPMRPTARTYAQDRFRAAEVFLTWLSARGRDPAATTQADIDAYWLTHGIHHQQAVRAFLTWATGQSHLPRLDVPVPQFAKGQALTPEQRSALLRRLADGDGTTLEDRVAASLMLLHGLPLSRILRLTAADVTRDPDGQVCLRVGAPPVPVPEPFAGPVLDLAVTRATQGWLFPGRWPGQPMAYTTMHRRLRALGLPMRTGRAAALRELVQQVPAPVAAEALGFHHTTTQRQRAAAGATWSRYATRSTQAHRPPDPAPAAARPGGRRDDPRLSGLGAAGERGKRPGQVLAFGANVDNGDPVTLSPRLQVLGDSVQIGRGYPPRTRLIQEPVHPCAGQLAAQHRRVLTQEPDVSLQSAAAGPGHREEVVGMRSCLRVAFHA